MYEGPNNGTRTLTIAHMAASNLNGGGRPILWPICEESYSFGPILGAPDFWRFPYRAPVLESKDHRLARRAPHHVMAESPEIILSQTTLDLC